MVVKWYGHILGLDMAKECMMVHEQSLSEKSEKNNSTWMPIDFKVLLMGFHFVKGGKWKNTLLTLMLEDKSFAFSIWLNLKM
jgi:hypothetical protein